MSVSLASERSSRRMIGTMYLGVAIHTTLVVGENIESGHVRMATYNIDMALLAQLMGALSQ